MNKAPGQTHFARLTHSLPVTHSPTYSHSPCVSRRACETEIVVGECECEFSAPRKGWSQTSTHLLLHCIADELCPGGGGGRGIGCGMLPDKMQH